MEKQKASRVSVVITTFNGSNYILKQIASLYSQTRKPDEVILVDDCSTDNTVELVEKFIADNNIHNWRVFVNKENIGWKQNFITAMRWASGDYLFPCDQDDVWYPEKLEEMVAALEDNPQILLLACDYRVIYEPGAIKAKIYNKTKKEKQNLIAKYVFTKHFFMNPYPGCSYAIRKGFFDEVNALWFSEAPHDEFLWLMATILDGAWFYNKTLMDYIRYGGNASSIRYKDIPMQLENLDYIAKMLQQMECYAITNSEKVDREYLRYIQIAQVWCEKRKALMKTRNPIRWLMLAPWWGYYNSPKNCLSDLWLAVFGKFRRLTDTLYNRVFERTICQR